MKMGLLSAIYISVLLASVVHSADEAPDRRPHADTNAAGQRKLVNEMSEDQSSVYDLVRATAAGSDEDASALEALVAGTNKKAHKKAHKKARTKPGADTGKETVSAISGREKLAKLVNAQTEFLNVQTFHPQPLEALGMKRQETIIEDSDDEDDEVVASGGQSFKADRMLASLDPKHSLPKEPPRPKLPVAMVERFGIPSLTPGCTCDAAQDYGACKKWFPHDLRKWCAVSGKCSGAVHRLPNSLRWAPCSDPLPAMPPEKESKGKESKTRGTSDTEEVQTFRPQPLESLTNWHPSMKQANLGLPSPITIPVQKGREGMKVLLTEAKRAAAEQAKSAPEQKTAKKANPTPSGVDTTPWWGQPVVVLGVAALVSFVGLLLYRAHYVEKSTNEKASEEEQQPIATCPPVVVDGRWEP